MNRNDSKSTAIRRWSTPSRATAIATATAAALLGLASSAHADGAQPTAPPPSGAASAATPAVTPAVTPAATSASFGIALTAGLSGVGVDLDLPINASFGLRATVSGLSMSRNGTYGTSDTWNGNLKLAQYGLLGDYYPFAGSFRLSAGVIYDANQLDVNGTSNGSYTFNGQTYNTGQISTSNGSVTWNRFVPYLGLGAGNLAGSPGFHTGFDLGVLFSGKPTVALNASCTPGSLACNQSTLNQNVAAERTSLQNTANKYRFWPVARVEIGYAF